MKEGLHMKSLQLLHDPRKIQATCFMSRRKILCWKNPVIFPEWTFLKFLAIITQELGAAHRNVDMAWTWQWIKRGSLGSSLCCPQQKICVAYFLFFSPLTLETPAPPKHATNFISKPDEESVSEMVFWRSLKDPLACIWKFLNIYLLHGLPLTQGEDRLISTWIVWTYSSSLKDIYILWLTSQWTKG